MKRFTFCLNFETADCRSYQTWATVRVNGMQLERLTNADGNGQRWEMMGYLLPGEHGTITRLFATNANEMKAAKLIATVLNRLGGETNMGGYGAVFKRATYTPPRVNPDTGRVLTAAPSIREGRPPRDKNVSEGRLRAGGGLMARDGGHNPLLAWRREGANGSC